VAIHQACQALQLGECDLALAGGANVLLTPATMITFSNAQMLAPDGRCKTFDAAADGYVRGEGCGVIVVKRLEDAIRDGDRIRAVIRGSAINQDGASGGLTVPNGVAQQRVIGDALRRAGLAPSEVGYLEAHGTGTSLGDPIEAQAAGAAYGPGRESDRPLLIGSAKTNIGHLEAAAGIAGVLKVVLSLEHEALPKHLHFENPSPHIPWNRLPVEVVKETIPWQRSDRPRIAGVSSFGFAGTNAHVIL
jgi:acyl transferase domain-containing protein